MKKMRNCSTERVKFMKDIMGFKPDAVSHLKGDPLNPQLKGMVLFYNIGTGTLVVADILGLPEVRPCGVFGFHIHEGNRCCGNTKDAFLSAGHYNPTNEPHPCHAGDMPPLFSNNGYAYMSFVSERFTAEEVIGRTVIIHSKPDDFTTQPSGDAGEKIACGVIEKYER